MRTYEGFLYSAHVNCRYVPQPAFLRNIKYIALCTFSCTFQRANPLEGAVCIFQICSNMLLRVRFVVNFRYTVSEICFYYFWNCASTDLKLSTLLPKYNTVQRYGPNWPARNVACVAKMVTWYCYSMELLQPHVTLKLSYISFSFLGQYFVYIKYFLTRDLMETITFIYLSHEAYFRSIV